MEEDDWLVWKWFLHTMRTDIVLLQRFPTPLINPSLCRGGGMMVVLHNLFASFLPQELFGNVGVIADWHDHQSMMAVTESSRSRDGGSRSPSRSAGVHNRHARQRGGAGRLQGAPLLAASHRDAPGPTLWAVHRLGTGHSHWAELAGRSTCTFTFNVLGGVEPRPSRDNAFQTWFPQFCSVRKSFFTGKNSQIT